MLARKTILGIVLLLCVTFVAPTLAATYYVSPDGSNSSDGLSWATAFATIQKGIDATSNGDIVEVNQGTYYESINFNGKNITVISTDPNDWSVVEATVINGNGATNTVLAHASLSGFTVTGGNCGVYCTVQGPTSPVVSNCIIRNNNDKGVKVFSCGATIKNCIIYDNGDEGIDANSASLTVTNSIIYGNDNGVVFANAGVTIRNCTIVKNSSYGVVKNNPYSAATISNSIVWDNGDDLSGCSATYSCIQDGDAGTGNISSAPCFVNADNNDFHINNNSLCVNAGDPNGPYTGQTDIDGQLRVIYGRVDMGADEWGKQIPELNWQERSDWINVKTDVTPPAVGDGVADDTEALQVAFDHISPDWWGDANTSKTVYLPAGTYRITNTLVLSRINSIWGATIVGDGRKTRIVWDGAEGGRILWTTGAIYTKYVGQVWDGRGKAAIGIDHASLNGYQTVIRHQNQNFINFTKAGIQTDQPIIDPNIPTYGVATAEILFQNCLFENCGYGVLIGATSYNCYDNSFDGCEFRNCKRGINCNIGNINVRNCHFESSSETDIFTSVSIHGKQIRRCSSIGSNMFLTDYYPWDTIFANHQIVQDCQISNWLNQEGAIVLGFRGPTTIFDCNFSNPPAGANPPIKLANSSYTKQTLIISNCSVDGSKQLNDLVAIGACNIGDCFDVIEVPHDSNVNKPGCLYSATQSFLKEQWRIPNRVFDAKVDFNAIGNGVTDDTNAIQQTINAARAWGNDAIAYIPRGEYIVTRTIDVNGCNYFIGGAGQYGTRIKYDGPNEGTLFHVDNPHNVVMENIYIDKKSVPSDSNVTKIKQTGSEPNTSILYDRMLLPIYTNEKGWEFVNLPRGTNVHLMEGTGSLEAENSSRAAILVDVLYHAGCYINIEGTEPQRDGFFGITSSSCSGGVDPRFTAPEYMLRVKDNQNIVWTGGYQETGKGIKLEGSADLPDGRVSFTPIRAEVNKPAFIEINNYKGRVFHGGADTQRGNPADPNLLSHKVSLIQSGENPVDIVLVGNVFNYEEPNLQISGPNATRILAGNIICDQNSNTRVVPDNIPEGGYETVAAALDDFRELGMIDITFNHPEHATGFTLGASNFRPINNASDVQTDVILSWKRGDWDNSYDIYLGTDSNAVSYADTTSEYYMGKADVNHFTPNAFDHNTTYYWRVDSKNAINITKGSVLSFTTLVTAPPAPNPASNPGPANEASDVNINVKLNWTAGSNAVSHNVYFGTDFDEVGDATIYDSAVYMGNQEANNWDATNYESDSIKFNTNYYWRIDEKNCYSVTKGDVWHFTTQIDPNLKHWWKFDEISGVTAYDSIGTANGTFNGNDPCWVRGNVGGAADFNGVSDYFSVSSLNTAYSSSSNFTASGWFYTSKTTGMQTIVGIWSNYNPAPTYNLYFGWQILVENKKVVARFGQASSAISDITGTTDVNDGWHHFALVYPTSSQNAVLYVDGQSQGTPAQRPFVVGPTACRIGDGSYVVGNLPLKGGPFCGTIDDVMIFNRALTANEVSQLYLAER